MRILLDHNVPRGLIAALTDYHLFEWLGPVVAYEGQIIARDFTIQSLGTYGMTIEDVIVTAPSALVSSKVVSDITAKVAAMPMDARAERFLDLMKTEGALDNSVLLLEAQKCLFGPDADVTEP